MDNMAPNDYIQSNSSKEILIYVHITKTAGGTLHRIIEKYYETEEVFMFHTAISRNSSCFEEIQAIPEKTLQKLKYVTGHIPCGNSFQETFWYCILSNFLLESGLGLYN